MSPQAKTVAKAPVSRNGGSASGRSKAAAAKGEVDEQAKSLKWKDIDLVLPPQPPGTMLFDLIALEGIEPDVLSLFRMLKSFLDWTDDKGVQHAQMLLVRNEIAAKHTDMENVADSAMDLFSQVTELYGMGLGESGASPAS